MRVVSLLPSATEIVEFLGHGEELLGRSEECDFPPKVQQLPVVMRARTLDSAMASREINDRVQKVRGVGESLYALDIDLLRTLRPELILTQDLCSVCSVTGEEVASACSDAGVEPRILSLSPRTLEEVWNTIPAIASALGDAQAGRRASSELAQEAGPRVPRSSAAPRVAVVEWLDPPILAGSWTPDMIEWAGGRPYGGVHGGAPEVRTSWAEITHDPPEILVASPCSFPLDRTERELADPALERETSALRGATNFWLADEAYFSRPGPRLRWGIDLLRSLIEGRAPRAPMPVRRYLPVAEVAAR